MTLSINDFEGLADGWSSVQRESLGDATSTQLQEKLKLLGKYIERFSVDNPSGEAFDFAYSAEKITRFQKLEAGVNALVVLERLGKADSAMRTAANNQLDEVTQGVEAVFNNGLSSLFKNLITFTYQQGKQKFGLDADLVAVRVNKKRNLARRISGKKLPEENVLIDKLSGISFCLTSRFADREMTLTSLESRTLQVIEDAIKRLNESEHKKLIGNKNGN